MPKSHSKQFSLYNSGLVLSSVEQLPTASASVAFTVDSGKVFREDADIVPVTLSNGIQYMPWGGDNLLPTTRWQTRPRFKPCATSTTTSTSPTTAPRPSMPTMPRPARRWTVWPCPRRRRLRSGSTPLPCWGARNKCEGRACQLVSIETLPSIETNLLNLPLPILSNYSLHPLE